MARLPSWRWSGLLGPILLAGVTAVPATSVAEGTRSLDPAVTLVTDNISIQASGDLKSAVDFTSFSDTVSGDGVGGAGHADVSTTASLDIGSDGSLQQIHLFGGADSFGTAGAPPGIMNMTVHFQVNRAIPFTLQFDGTVTADTNVTCGTGSFVDLGLVDTFLGVKGPPPLSGSCDWGPEQLTTSITGILDPGDYYPAWHGGAFGPQGSADVQFDTTLILGCAVPGSGDCTTDFKWTMPDRFGSDADGDGLTDYYPPDGDLVIDPGSWQVDFTATDPNYCDPAYTHTWFIDSVPVDPSDPNIVSYDPATCDFSYAFPEEAVHDVGFQVTDAQGTVVGTADHSVTVQDFLIVSIGDSVGSGEGNPDISKPSLRWENQQCHRSASAGAAQAAKLAEQADPRTSVTFIHLACSGATILKGLLGPYEGIEPGSLLNPQVRDLRTLVGTREIDAVLVSVGANDVHFADIVKSCFLHSNCDDASDPSSAAAMFNRALPNLPGGYARLAGALTRGTGGMSPARVYITEYFDPTRGQGGTVCSGHFGILEDAPFSALGEITDVEATWASTGMLPALNGEVASAAASNGWRYVAGQYADFAVHGYCAKGGGIL